MKLKLLIILASVYSLLLSCEVDNYDAPDSSFYGYIKYNDQNLSFRRAEVQLQMWEKGWDNFTPLPVYVDQTGKFSSKFFNGDYILKIEDHEGPFIFEKDSIVVNLRGSQQLDIQVLPYYIFKSINFGKIIDSTVTVNFALEKIIKDSRAKDIEKVTLYISNTQFVAHNTKLAEKEIDGTTITDLGNITLKIDIPKTPRHYNTFFLRVGVKIKDRNDRLYSDLGEVSLK